MDILSVSIAVSYILCAQSTEKSATESKPTKELRVGDTAPDFEFVFGYDQEQKPIRKKLSDFRGSKNVLLAFYPKAFTSGCTKQLCGYRDDIQDLESHDLQIIAISTDEQPESDKFREHHGYPFPVVGDPDRKIIDSYNVPVMSNGYATRSVFLIDKAGKIAYIDMSYNVDKGKDQLYQAVGDLDKKE